MLTERLNIFEYEEVLMGVRKNFICSFKGTFKENCEEVGNIWRYAVTHLLKWSPKEAEKYMTDKIVDMLCLDKTLAGIGFNRTGSYISDYRFVLQYAFPKEIQFDERKQAIAEYDRVAKIGKWEYDDVPYKFPKKFFVDNSGIDRARYLLEYVVGLYLAGRMSQEDLYEFFSKKQKASRWLASKKLEVPIKIIYESPLDFFHYSLPIAEKDDFLYYFYKLTDAYQARLKEIRKEEMEEKKVSKASQESAGVDNEDAEDSEA